MTPTTDHFGFLADTPAIEFGDYRIEPNGSLERSHPWVARITNESFIGPRDVQRALLTADEVIRSGIRWQDSIWKLAPTHQVQRRDGAALPVDFRQREGWFVIHLVAFWFRARAQFDDWWFDARIPYRMKPVALAAPEREALFLEHALDTWRSASRKEQQLLANTLYLHGRSLQSDLDWERFLMAYIVGDAVWRIHESRKRAAGGPVPSTGHSQRFEVLAQDLGLYASPGIFKPYTDLRHALVHEGLWDGHQPGTGGSVHSAMAAHHLHRFNQRALIALLERPHPRFCQSNWEYIGLFMFD